MDIPLAYLLACSRNILGEFQLSRLDRAAQLKREIRERHEKMIENEVAAAFALWLREHREQIIALCSSEEVEKLLEGG